MIDENELTREREINAVLVEALEEIAHVRCAWQLSQEKAREALAKAEEMRK